VLDGATSGAFAGRLRLGPEHGERDRNGARTRFLRCREEPAGRDGTMVARSPETDRDVLVFTYCLVGLA